MDTATAMPTAEERSVCPHHLIDVVFPEESYPPRDFVATRCGYRRNRCARRIPLLAGGTMQYFKLARRAVGAAAGDPPFLAEIDAAAARSAVRLCTPSSSPGSTRAAAPLESTMPSASSARSRSCADRPPARDSYRAATPAAAVPAAPSASCRRPRGAALPHRASLRQMLAAG